MKLFQQLGARIEEQWRSKNYNEEHLPAIAGEELTRADLPSQLSAWDVLEWALAQTELPPQRDLHGNFGDPPITIYSGPRFHIDVYFWFTGTTSIHQHGFCGAFQVLLGSSIHSWYEFEREQIVNAFCETGRMSLKLCELLEVGAVQEIRAGRQYIHSLFHLEQPSATIVVRTDRSPLHLPQFSYNKPGLALDPTFEQPTLTKKIQSITALVRAERPETDSLINRFFESADAHSSFLMLSHLRNILRSNQLDQLFKLEKPKEKFDTFLDVVMNRHGEASSIFKPVFERLDVQDEIVNRRSYVTEPEHRFFLALLLNVDSRDNIFALIKQRFSSADTIEKILDWVFDLAETRVVGIDAGNALGIPDFGETEMTVLENLLKGKTDDEILADDSAAVDAIAKIRNAAIFRSLLS